MRTLRLSLDAHAALALDRDPLAQQALTTAAHILQNGGTVAFATETVYGLGANALDAEAIAKIFVAKQRPAWDPLIVHVADESMLMQVAASIPPAARALMVRFWPGPLTLLVPRHPNLPDAVTAGRASVGVRMPAHPVAQALIRAAGLPIAAPSANTFGHVSPTTAAHVAADLDGRIDAILDSGVTLHGLESTVLDTCPDASQSPCILYRPGAISLEQLRGVWPSIEPYSELPATGHEATPAALPSPGIGMRHYAPRAQLVLVEINGADADLSAELMRAFGARVPHKRVGLMLPDGLAAAGMLGAQAGAVYAWGPWSDRATLAHRLFAGLRALDAAGVEVILCPVPTAEGLGAAIIDRLRKAARPT